MKKTSVKTTNVNKYQKLNLIELENTIITLQTQHLRSPSPELTQDLSAARFCLQQRQRLVKAKVMDFERTNHSHLLFYVSTKGFVKLAGHSALFFAMTIADRIHWRYSLKIDTDHYSISDDGIISFRSLENISTRLAEINIFPNPKISDAELHYFDLAKSYSADQIDRLRDNAQQDIKRIMSIVLPASPIPNLYDAIMQASQLLYYQFKHLPDAFAREVLGNHLFSLSYDMAIKYMLYARQKNKSDVEYLREIIELSREIRYGIAYASKLQILHHREVCKILEYLVAVERIAGKAYLRDQDNHKKNPHK